MRWCGDRSSQPYMQMRSIRVVQRPHGRLTAGFAAHTWIEREKCCRVERVRTKADSSLR